MFYIIAKLKTRLNQDKSCMPKYLGIIPPIAYFPQGWEIIRTPAKIFSLANPLKMLFSNWSYILITVTSDLCAFKQLQTVCFSTSAIKFKLDNFNLIIQFKHICNNVLFCGIFAIIRSLLGANCQCQINFALTLKNVKSSDSPH